MEQLRMALPHHEAVPLNDIFTYIADKIHERGKWAHHSIIIGTDSQRHGNKTKYVRVIALHQHGKGARFWYTTEWTPVEKVLANKIYIETEKSLEIARAFQEWLTVNGNSDIMTDSELEVHVDIGPWGKTRTLIKEIVGWVTSEGFTVKVKPGSIAASCVADKLSK